MLRTVGDLNQTVEDVSVEWRINGFFSLSDQVDAKYHSSSFLFLGEAWYLSLYPNGQSKRGTEEWIAVYLFRSKVSSPLAVACSIGLKRADGKKYIEMDFTNVFEEYLGHGYSTFVKRSVLIEKKTTLVPSDVLTITCCLKTFVPSLVSRTEELSRDFRSLLKDGTDSDVIVRVDAEEFRLHRNILGVRSPVFEAMFRHETEEKVTGIVSIEDCRADVFRTFAHYLYTGKVEELSAGDVFDLFKVADKYQVKELEDGCVSYMKDTLTVDTFCDAIEVALNHDKQNLLNRAVELLSDKMEKIINTDQWQSFLLENPVRANELLKKAFAKKNT